MASPAKSPAPAASVTPAPSSPVPAASSDDSLSSLTSSLAGLQFARGAPPLRCGLVYDKRCALHSANYLHVEQPARITFTYDYLSSEGVLPHLVSIPSHEATDEELRLTHDQQHINMINETANYPYKQPEPDSESEDDPVIYADCQYLDGGRDTFANAYSAQAARLAAGSVMKLMEALIVDKSIDNGFALVRPPGHHNGVGSSAFDPHHGLGFCLFNNVAVAINAMRAKYAHPSPHAEALKRVLIVDWDVHHGNGTQALYYNDPSVLYFSVHRFSPHFYPGTGAKNECGEGAGLGYSVNVPIAESVGDQAYMAVWTHILLPLCEAFKPNLIVVSAGFDCAAGDPLGKMEVSPAGFSQMTAGLMKVPDSKLLLALEGGYNLQSIAHSMKGCIETLMGYPAMAIPTLEFVSKRDEVKFQQRHSNFISSLNDVIKVQQKYWPTLRAIAHKPFTAADSEEDTAAQEAAAQLKMEKMMRAAVKRRMDKEKLKNNNAESQATEAAAANETASGNSESFSSPVKEKPAAPASTDAPADELKSAGKTRSATKAAAAAAAAAEGSAAKQQNK